MVHKPCQLVFTAVLLFYPQILVCKLISANLSNLSCCVYFAAISKQKFSLQSSSLALVELRGSRAVLFTCVCVPECRLDAAKQTRTRIWEQALELRAESV